MRVLAEGCPPPIAHLWQHHIHLWSGSVANTDADLLCFFRMKNRYGVKYICIIRLLEGLNESVRGLGCESVGEGLLLAPR